MTPTPVDVTLARRELVLVAVILVAFTRLVERSDAFLVVILLPAVILLAGSAILRADERPGRPVESLLVPAVLTGGTAAALQLVPAGLGLVPALAVFAFGLDRILALEIRLLEQPAGVTDADRARVLGGAMVTAFIAFTGVAALVPGGLPEPGSTGIDAGLSEGWLVVLAVGDALVALVLGYRVASVRYGSRRDALRSALTYAIVIAVAAGAHPRHGRAPARRPRRPDAGLLPVGRAPRHRARQASRAPLPVGDDPPRRARGRGGRLEPAAPRLTPRPVVADARPV